ncbi:MAG TPA: fructose-1,6-bisphosphatase [Candidatus Scatomorpha stercorigallinarum]|nr:fructose-1,6-bisphosphatase [Candidatus Scatomorpha stercorigallinarum]
MGDLTREYLELLSEKYPNEPAVCSELIKLRSVLSLPKGTEHFISDLHGEYAAVRHILNNCSGVILEKVRRLFGDTLGEERCHALCSVIYYPPEALNALRERGELTDERLRETLESLRTLAETLSSKYTRGYVRRRMPEEWAFVLDELLHLQRDEDANQLRYHDALVSSVIASGAAEQVIAALAALIKRLAVERLHVVGDIFDRGSEPARIVELLMERGALDIQWGNHDILWLGAAAGSPACIFTVLRITLEYGNETTLERRYGVSLRPLVDFAGAVYGSRDKRTVIHALSVLGFKLEGQVIRRHPGYGMDDRLMLDRVDFAAGTVRLDTGAYPLTRCDFPTIDPAGDRYALTEAEAALVEEYVSAFRESQPLRRHMDFIYQNGSTYLCCNGNLLYHGCIPMTPEGQFARVRHGGKWYSGRALMDYADAVVKSAWARADAGALDMMWYLWCGRNSPFSGREFHTFERAMVADRSTWAEPRNPYFDLWESEAAVKLILTEFGLDPESGHIINGHTPVKAKKGESPVKAGGRLFIIDGGFCKAYQPTTGIAGYTLIYNSHGIRLKSHRPFEGVARVIGENADMESDSVVVESFPRRRYVSDTDEGAVIGRRIEALERLLALYRSGEMQQR